MLVKENAFSKNLCPFLWLRKLKFYYFPLSNCYVLGIIVKFLDNWEYTMWKFQDFSATHILREINCGQFEAPKTANLTI